jgi:hypothetical protein
MAASETSKNEKTPLVKQIAQEILAFDPTSIPSDVATHAKTLILDSIGCALAALEEQAFERALCTFEALGGNRECTIIGTKHRMPVTNAVLLNGILIRALDLNDAYVGPGQMGHPSDNIAVALSVGEKQGSSGLDVLASVIGGYEIYCRIQDIIVGRGLWRRRRSPAGSSNWTPSSLPMLLRCRRPMEIHCLRFVPDNFPMPKPWPMPWWLTKQCSAACSPPGAPPDRYRSLKARVGSNRRSLPGPT